MSNVIVKENESLDSALRRFKRNCAKAGIQQEIRKREHYEKPSVRRKKKSEFRALWIQRINAAVRLEGLSYSKFMGLIHKADVDMNRKVLADLAMNHPEAFKAVVAKAKEFAK